MTDSLKYVFCALAIAGFFCFCTPQKRLNRLVKNNPELADTISQVKTITVPEIRIDTVFKASENTEGLTQILDQYKNVLDSLTRVKLTNQVHNYITERNCLQDTLNIKIGTDGFCKVWQTGKLFHYLLKIPEKKYSLSFPTLIVHPVIKYNWQMFAGGIIVGWLILFLLIQFLKTR